MPVQLAVCGLHMRGLALQHQLTDLGASFLRADKTASVYRLFALAGQVEKPGLVRVNQGGSSVAVEVWELQARHLGHFLVQVPPPLTLGTLTLADESRVLGFLCESYVTETSQARDITGYGGWHAYVACQEAPRPERREEESL